MGKYLQWAVLSSLTGSPLGSLVLLIVFWAAVDRFTWGLLPDPLVAFTRFNRAAQLRSRLNASPHDRRARFELAQLLLDQRRHQAAVDMLKPNLEAGDDDVYTHFLMGTACFGAARFDDGEKYLGMARTREPGFRLGSIDLELGRGRLKRGDAAGAKDPLERLCQTRPSTVEGRFLLARALDGAGDVKGALAAREAAWESYAAAPVFHRRRERWWAWRAKPSRPLGYALVAVLAITVFIQLAGS